MSLSLLQSTFAARSRHTSPFLMLGDPTPELSVALARAAVDAGATMLELGLPYSDPCADGPAIQEACLRARHAGVSTPQALDVLSAIAAACPATPLNLLVYGNLVHARGYGSFCSAAAAAGASTLLVPDIPLEEGVALRAACDERDLGTVQLVGPLTSPARLAALDEAADGFLYLAAHQGVTGAELDPIDQRSALVRRVVGSVQRPVCVGFGLKSATDVAAVFEAGAALAVIGSHLARVIGTSWQESPGDGAQLIDRFATAFRSLIPESSTATAED